MELPFTVFGTPELSRALDTAAKLIEDRIKVARTSQTDWLLEALEEDLAQIDCIRLYIKHVAARARRAG